MVKQYKKGKKKNKQSNQPKTLMVLYHYITIQDWQSKTNKNKHLCWVVAQPAKKKKKKQTAGFITIGVLHETTQKTNKQKTTQTKNQNQKQ